MGDRDDLAKVMFDLQQQMEAERQADELYDSIVRDSFRRPPLVRRLLRKLGGSGK